MEKPWWDRLKSNRWVREATWLIAVSPGIYFAQLFLLTKSPVALAHEPGMWLGTRSSFEILPVISIGCPLALLGLAIGVSIHKNRTLVCLLAFIAACGFAISSQTAYGASDPMPRIRAELQFYKRAVKDKVKFGDQFTETHGKRTLHYWRWLKWGIDDAYGVFYDSKDKLSPEDKFFKFESNGGGIYKLVKIEPHWYFVQHS